MKIILPSFSNFRRLSSIILLFLYVQGNCQTITGVFSGHPNQQIRLMGFKGFDTCPIDSAVADEHGAFRLFYSKEDQGMGYLMSAEGKVFYIVLGGESVALKGVDLASPETIAFIAGKENKLFEQYASEHGRREQALSAWVYLEKMYRLDSLFSNHTNQRQFIAGERRRIRAEDSLFLAGLPENSYVSWYLPLRKLLGSVQVIAQYRPEEIPSAISAFRALDYTDERLYKSGLLRDAVESHFWLIENSGRSLDSVYAEMRISIDCLISNLKPDEKKLNETSEYLFDLLEKRSLFGASEYLALKLLNEKTCTLNNSFADRLESYRIMKKGNTAPEIEFGSEIYAPNYTTGKIPRRLSEINSDYTVVIFGASWCPQCPVELAQLVRSYPVWKSQNMEVVFVSLDENRSNFQNFTKVFPFISICDYKKWESAAVKNFHVFATPTIYLLDHKREILLRPNSVSQLDAWVDWYLVKGNK